MHVAGGHIREGSPASQPAPARPCPAGVSLAYALDPFAAVPLRIASFSSR